MATWENWLRRARRRAGFSTQAELAKALGISRGSVGNWESGVSKPSMANAERLAVLLKRPRSEVLGVSPTAPSTKSVSGAIWGYLESRPGFNEDLRKAEAELEAGRGVRYEVRGNALHRTKPRG